MTMMNCNQRIKHNIFNYNLVSTDNGCVKIIGKRNQVTRKSKKTGIKKMVAHF